MFRSEGGESFLPSFRTEKAGENRDEGIFDEKTQGNLERFDGGRRLLPEPVRRRLRI